MKKYHTMSDFSSWGVPGTLEMKPEITAPGGNIYSVNGLIAGGTSYENMSSTSMATPSGGRHGGPGGPIHPGEWPDPENRPHPRVLAQSLLMSTAVPSWRIGARKVTATIPSCARGAGLANVSKAIAADSTFSWVQTPTNPMPMAR